MKMTKDYRPGIIWKSVGISIILHEFYKNGGQILRTPVTMGWK